MKKWKINYIFQNLSRPVYHKFWLKLSPSPKKGLQYLKDMPYSPKFHWDISDLSWLSFVVSSGSVSLSLSHWYPVSGVVLDCIDS